MPGLEMVDMDELVVYRSVKSFQWTSRRLRRLEPRFLDARIGKSAETTKTLCALAIRCAFHRQCVWNRIGPRP